MNREELVTALRRMAPETGSHCCLGCGYEHGCSTHGCAIIRAAVEAIEAMPVSPSNQPLTLEELREMDGGPVYLYFGHGLGECALVLARSELEGGISLRLKNGILTPARFVVECGGNIYRRKPEEDANA